MLADLENPEQYRQLQDCRRDRKAYFDWLDEAAAVNAEHNSGLSDEELLAIIEQAREEVHQAL